MHLLRRPQFLYIFPGASTPQKIYDEQNLLTYRDPLNEGRQQSSSHIDALEEAERFKPEQQFLGIEQFVNGTCNGYVEWRVTNMEDPKST